MQLAVRWREHVGVAPLLNADNLPPDCVLFVVAAATATTLPRQESLVEGTVDFRGLTPTRESSVALALQYGGQRYLIGWGKAADPAMGLVESRAKRMRPTGLSTWTWRPVHDAPATSDARVQRFESLAARWRDAADDPHFARWYEEWYVGDREPLLRFLLADGGYSSTPALESTLKSAWERVHSCALDSTR